MPLSDFDIYANKSFRWYTGTDDDDRKAIPYVELIEYDNRTDITLQRQIYLSDSAVGMGSRQAYKSFKDVFGNFYQVVPTGRSLKLPYLGKSPFSMKTTYATIDVKKDGNISEWNNKVTNWFYTAPHKLSNWFSRTARSLNPFVSYESEAKANARHPEMASYDSKQRAGISPGLSPSIKKWHHAETSQYETSFHLINDTDEHIKNHYIFIRSMMWALAPSYPNIIEVQVPFLYEIRIPSQLHIPLGFISPFSATPKGTSTMIGGIVVPEAWEIKMTFNSLFPPSRQLLDTIDEPNGTDYGLNVMAEGDGWTLGDVTTMALAKLPMLVGGLLTGGVGTGIAATAAVLEGAGALTNSQNTREMKDISALYGGPGN